MTDTGITAGGRADVLTALSNPITRSAAVLLAEIETALATAEQRMRTCRASYLQNVADARAQSTATRALAASVAEMAQTRRSDIGRTTSAIARLQALATTFDLIATAEADIAAKLPA